MFRTTIRADENTDPDAIASTLRRECELAGVPELLGATLVEQTRALLAQLAQMGSDLAARGSQMSVTRELTGEGYSVQIIFGAGQKSGFFQRLWQRITTGS